ncbi:hypothetical protein [Streptomyces parvulus]|uniref:hypothetical protein n=1 Tax=Streptomyces parvulus TaxID=146923 RepID=UPI00339F0C10
MPERRPADAASRGFMRSVDRVLVWLAPALAVVMVVLAVANLATGAAAGRVMVQFALALVMVITAMTARARLSADAFPEESRT